MADPSQIYHTSGTPPLLYYKGNEIIGGTVTSVDKKQDMFLCGTLYSLSSESRMGVIGEMPVMLSMRKNGNGFEPYEEFLERQAKIKGEEK